MYEEFTDRARRAMVSAQEEAAHHGAAYVSTEHELLGIVDDDDCVGAILLDRLGAQHKLVRSEVEAQVCHIGSDIVGPPKLTPLGRHVIEYAREEARMLGEGHVGTGHLLLGLIRERDGLAARTLSRLGIEIAMARWELKSLRASGVTEAVQKGLG
jgi:ATP-dependent Clp protease ATP-binding subunit ClpC